MHCFVDLANDDFSSPLSVEEDFDDEDNNDDDDSKLKPRSKRSLIEKLFF